MHTTIKINEQTIKKNPRVPSLNIFVIDVFLWLEDWDVDGGDDLGDLGAVCDLGDPVHLSLKSLII